MPEPTYKIIRFYWNDDHGAAVVGTGFTEAEAKAHCQDPETSWRTATSLAAQVHTDLMGPWFDGWTEE